ncbi:MAG: hypothetical protein GX639_10140 [Fibrobacter sp.]|nr:hypothetical protein [Fibrobacter sp.]
MIHTSPEKLIIERYVAGELGENKAHELTTHLAECSVCNEYHKSLTRERETFLRVYPYGELLRRKALVTAPFNVFAGLKKLLDMLNKPILFPVYASFLFFVIITPMMFSSKQDTTQFKGAHALSFAYQRSGNTIQGTSAYRLQSGDKVQIFFTSGGYRHASLLSVDKNGAVSFYHPDGSSQYCSVNVTGGTQEPFPGSILFNDVQGDELVVLVLSETPVTVDQAKAWVADSFSKNSQISSLGRNLGGRIPGIRSSVNTLLLVKD